MEILVPIARFKAFLTNGISATDTSLTIDKSTDTDGNTLSGKYFIVIDKKKTNREYMAVTFSGANGTMTLSERGISLVDGKTGDATRRFAHDKGAPVEIVDYPYLTRISRQLKAQDELENIPVVPLSVATAQTGTVDKELATVNYVKNVSFAGAPDATATNKGISRLTVAPVNPTMPIAVGDNDPRLLGTFGTPSNTNRYVTAQDTSAGGTRSANTISFTAATKTIADTGNGLGVFNVGEQIVVTGSTSNNGTYTISSVTPSAIIVNETLLDETAGANVTITSPLTNRVVRTNSSGILPVSSIPTSIDTVTYPLGEDITVGATPVPVMIINTNNPLHRCQSFIGSSFSTATISPTNFVGQTFTTGSTTTRLRFIRVLLSFSNYVPSVNEFKARLFATSGGVPTGPALAEAKPYTTTTGGDGKIAPSYFLSFPESDLQFFDFGEVTVTPNTQYAIVFSVGGFPTGSLDVGVSGSNPYSGGTLITAPTLAGPYTISSSFDIPLDIFEYNTSNNYLVVRARPSFNGEFNYRRIGGSALPTFPMWGCDGFITQSGVAGDLRQVTISGNLSGFSGLTPNENYYVNGVGTIALGNQYPRAGIAVNSTTLRLYPSTNINFSYGNQVRLIMYDAGGPSSYTYTKNFYTMYSKYLTSRQVISSGPNGFSVNASASNSTGTYSTSGDIFNASIFYTNATGTHVANHNPSGYQANSLYMH